MQFNRDKYLAGEFDNSDINELKNYNTALTKSGVEWNMYISQYLLLKIREDLLAFDASQLTPILSYIPLLYIGMFNTAGAMLYSTDFGNEDINKFKEKWVPFILSANDIKDEDVASLKRIETLKKAAELKLKEKQEAAEVALREAKLAKEEAEAAAKTAAAAAAAAKAKANAVANAVSELEKQIETNK